MKHIRATIRLLALATLTGGLYCLWLVLRPLVLPFPAGSQAWRNWIFRHWALGTVRLLGIRIDVNNRPPAAPFLLVSNHLSYVDVVVLASQLDCTFIAKSEVAGWPVIGLMCRAMSIVFIDRSRKRDIPRAIAKTREMFDNGLGVVLFAEGTSTSGRSVSPFKSSLLECAASHNLPVHHASVSYSTPEYEPCAEQAVCWWGDMTFSDHLFRLLQLSRFNAKLTFGEQPILESDRRVLASRLWKAVSADFTAIASHG